MLHSRHRYLLAMRALSLLAVLVLSLFCPWPWGMLGLVSVFAMALNWWQIKSPKATLIGNGNYLGWHLWADIILLCLLLYGSDGAGSAFVSILLVPVGIAAIVLRPLPSSIATGLAIVGYALLLVNYLQLPNPAVHGHHGTHFRNHVIDMGINFVVSALLLGGVVAVLSASLRRRDQHLAEARMAAVANEQVVAVASLAASTAHQLATPLATTLALAEELHSDATSEQQRQDVKLLQQQLNLCRDHIQQLAQAQPDVTHPQALRPFVEQAITRWQLMRPGQDINLQLDAFTNATANVGLGVTQAIAALLDNATDASSNKKPIDVHATLVKQQAILSIRDHGQGMPEQILLAGPEAQRSDKEQGMGLGLWLAQYHLQQINGQLQLANHPTGGACISIHLPLVFEP